MPAPAGPPGVARTGAAGNLLIRVDQVGYVAGCAKLALVMSDRPLAGPPRFQVNGAGGRVALTGIVGPRRGSWSTRWRYVYPLDFSALHAAGSYDIQLGAVRSPSFRIGAARSLYDPLTANAVSFFQAQRDGPHVIAGALDRQPSHLRDARAAVYQQPLYSDVTLLAPLQATGAHVNALGGWFDAGDYLKFTETASFSDVMMLWTLRDYAGGIDAAAALRREARFGLDWLFRMWDARRRVLYYQVGIGDGNGASILGDHDFWRVPQADDGSRARPGSPDYYVSNRPVFAANRPGGPISPNLAGRVAAAFALCAQVFALSDRAYAERCLRAGDAIYSLADSHPGALLSTSPHAYYGDGIWQDDLELAAVELYLAERAVNAQDTSFGAGARAPALLNAAGEWANAYASSPANSQDTLNVFDLAPLAHYDLIRVLRTVAVGFAIQRAGSVNIATDPASLLSDLHDQLALASRVAHPDPFRLANVAGNTDTVPHALGVAIQARLYDALTSSTTFEGLAQTQLDWVLGANAWGSSFVVGAGDSFPNCLAHQVANLSGSLSGHSPSLLGATVDGPNDPASLRDLGAPDGYRKCPADGVDRFRQFDTPQVAYIDDVTSSSTSEPADDYVALALLAFSQAAQVTA